MNCSSKLSRSLVIGATVLGGAMPVLAGNVIVVDDSGPADFNAIQPAVDAALDGDTILVKTGSYTSFTVDDKALTIVGDSGVNPLPIVNGRIWIRNLDASRVVTLVGLAGTGIAAPGAFEVRAPLRVEHCDGAVRVDGCALDGSDSNWATSHEDGGDGVILLFSSDVALSRCAVTGGNGFYDFLGCDGEPGFGGKGLLNGGSSIAAYECELRGGRGGTGNIAGGVGDGGPGAYLTDLGPMAFLFSSGSLFKGGDPGPRVCLLKDVPGGDVGPGMYLTGSWTAHLLDSDVQPQADGGTPFQYTVSSLGLSLAPVARESTSVAITFTGDPGDPMYLNDAFTTTFVPVPTWRGVQLVPFGSADQPVSERVRRWGVIPASGTLTKTYHVPALPPGVEAQTRFLQAYRLNGAGLTLGSFATLTVVDSAF